MITQLPKMGFLEYYESRRQLEAALVDNPRTEIKYTPTKYTSLQLQEPEDVATIVGIKPSNTLVIEWHYKDDINRPDPIRCTILDKHGEQVASGTPVLESMKLQRWLIRHAEVNS